MKKQNSSSKQNHQNVEENVVYGHKPVTLKDKFKEFLKNPKKRMLLIGGIGLLLLIVFGTGLYLLTNESSIPPSVKDNDKEETVVENKTLYPAVLTGEMLESEASANKHPLAIIVENDVNARPQSGLEQADLVYETVYDPAATTRFLAVYGSKDSEKVGPIRSIRTFFVDLAHGLDAYLGHWGGNIDALDQIRKEGSPDLDEFAYPGAYWRDRSAGVSSDHTGYTSTIKLREQAEKNNYIKANNFNVYRFKDLTEEEVASLPESQSITVNFSNQSYAIEYKYSKAENTYKRFLAGKPHVDNISKRQLTAKNVIVMEVSRKKTVTRINEPGYNMDIVGSGKAHIFFNGTKITGTWKKESKTDREMFYDDSGNEISFSRGNFWISLVPNLSQISVE